MLKKTAALWKRFQEMPKDEIEYRIQERIRIEADRLRFYTKTRTDLDRAVDALIARYQGSIKTYLQHRPAGRFYASLRPDQIGILKSLVEEQFPEWCDRSVAEANQICAHRFDLLAYPCVGLTENIDWHRDPISGYQWPRRFWADYRPVTDQADAKIIHELNRHQHLPRLAKAFVLTGDEHFAQEAVREMQSWIAQNPVGDGVNWQSSLEIAIRSLSWMWTIFMLLPSAAFDEHVAETVLCSLFSQIDHVYRYPSTYSSPNTHLIGEATAIFIAGLLFAELPSAERWKKKGAELLISAMDRQVNREGVYLELSSYYHCYAADFFLQALTLARGNRFPMPGWMWRRLGQMFEFVMGITRPDGTIPLLGDDDGGRVISLNRQHYRSYTDGLCSAAVLYGRADFKQSAGGFSEETLWLLGADAWQIFDSLSCRPPSALSRSCPEAGYFIQRSGWGINDSHLVFDCGGYGMSSGGHAHADALSICLFGGGRELLVDAATSIYNGAAEWRNYFRSTSAHNTVIVDGVGQSSPAGTFVWQAKPSSRLLNHFSSASIEYVDGEHDGYVSLPQSVVHRRRVLFVRPKYWIVLDELRGRGPHTFDFLYHFPPGAELFVVGEESRGEIECRASMGMATGLDLSLYGSDVVSAEAICAQIEPIQGWVSHRYGDRKAAPVLKATMRRPVPAGMMTLLKPFSADCPGGVSGLRSRRVEVKGGAAIAAAVLDGENEDICIQSLDPDTEMRMGDLVMRGELFWLRRQQGILRQVVAVNASMLSNAGDTLINEEKALAHVLMHFWENGMVIERGDAEGNVYVRDLRGREFQRN